MKAFNFITCNIEVLENNIMDIHKGYDNSTKNYDLNTNVKGPFCKFKIEDNVYLKCKGIYVFFVDGQIKYVGRCLSSFARRINGGYGNISPRNCYKGGQRTNCHVNKLVNDAIINNKAVKIGLLPLTDENMIKDLEKILIKIINPEWNIQLCNK